MPPALVVVDGPLKGTTALLSDSELSIGRDESNVISLDDILVSRRHCVVRKDASGYRIVDLESRNGIFVNELPVKDRLLEDGDVIRVGKSSLCFTEREGEDDERSSGVEFYGAMTANHAVVELKPHGAVYLQPDAITLGRSASHQRVARDLSALLRIGTEISSCRNQEAVGRLLLERIFDVVPAEHGAILLAERGGDAFESSFAIDRELGSGETVRVSQTIAQYVLLEGVSVLTSDVPSDDQFGEAESLVAAQVRSVLAAPLIVPGGAVGVLYLESAQGAERFDDEHLQFVTAVAGIAAVAIENARYFEWLEDETSRLRDELNLVHDLVGESDRMREVYRFIERVAKTDSTVLLGGESGTEKELVARAIHRNSSRATRPFVAINCAALTETLLESELFGHEKGAFTGAVAQRRGKLEVADGGTLFLDEVGELALPLQAKLLRALQEREFERVGGTRPVKVDIRLVAATNRNLEEAVAAGTFRQDLFSRLNVVSLTMPPLRERRGDIPLLTSYFIKKYSVQCNRDVHGLSKEARECLLRYDWPGNVRELRNAIERAVALGSSELILPEDLPEALVEKRPASGARLAKYHEAIADAKARLVLDALEQTKGKYGEAAKLLGVHRNYLHRLIRNLELKVDSASKT